MTEKLFNNKNAVKRTATPDEAHKLLAGVDAIDQFFSGTGFTVNQAINVMILYMAMISIKYDPDGTGVDETLQRFNEGVRENRENVRKILAATEKDDSDCPIPPTFKI